MNVELQVVLIRIANAARMLRYARAEFSGTDMVSRAHYRVNLAWDELHAALAALDELEPGFNAEASLSELGRAEGAIARV
jgi:hypothetical protein